MNLNAAALRLLADKGLSASDIAELAEAMEVRKDPTAAARMRRYRAKKEGKNGEHVTRNVTPVTPPYEVSSTPQVPPLHDRSDHSEEDVPALLPEHVLEAWNAMADRQGLPKAKLTPERKRKLTSRIRQHTIDDFTEAIMAVERSPFLQGENDRGWRADFDFLLQPASFTKLIEGSYDRPSN